MQFDPNSVFPPKSFDDEPSPSLTGEKTIILFYRDFDKNKNQYENFNNSFKTFLTKLPDNNVKHFVDTIFQKDLVFIGTSPVRNDGIFSRVLLTNTGKLAGIVLDSSDLNIDLESGETDQIDDCVYASYFGLIRAAVILNKNDVRQNKRLHKLLSTYLFLIMLKVLGKNNLYSEKQKTFVHITCVYAYYKFMLNENVNMIFSILKNDYANVFDTNYLSEFIPMLRKLKNYESVKDIPKMLVDLNLIRENPNIVIIELLKTLKSSGFYAFIGSLDYFIAMVVLSKYPSNLFSKDSLTNDKIHSAVEEEIINYVKKIKFDLTSVPKHP